MLTARCEAATGTYSKYLQILEINKESLKQAYEIFEDYRQQGVILNSCFDDAVWTMTNEKIITKISFEISEKEFCEKAYKWLGCTVNSYRDSVKAYITFNLGNINLGSLRDICKSLKKMATSSFDEVISQNEQLNHRIGLLQIIPNHSEHCDYVIEELEDKAEAANRQKKYGKQRILADFRSYLNFDAAITNFWETADTERKLFYFPLYFWWNLTSILPLRPTEFLLTPRECLEKTTDGNMSLTIRRTKLKGGYKRVTYKIEGDYECKKYVISQKLACEIKKYIELTENMHKPKIGTLLVTEPKYVYEKSYSKGADRHYSYVDLRLCLAEFYNEIIVKGKLEIQKIHLGDTRHIAMANLIITGGSPVICKELAGHSDIDISSHYYSNISNLVECITLQKFRMSKGKRAEIIGQPKYTLTLPETKHRVVDGWCDVLSVENGDVSECLKVMDENGHIGNCNCCIHYWPDIQGMRLHFFDEHIGKEHVDMDCQFLMQMIELTRKGLGCPEDIGKALLRLQRSSNHYSKCLWEKYINTEENHG